MSFDLYLYPKKFDAAAIADYFAARPNYKGSAYENEDTGVYFAFQAEEAPEPEDDGAPRRPYVHFNLNFYRPHVFALEAEPEVAAFVQHFNCRIEDPQTDGMDEGAYTRDGFLKGWNTGNRFGFTAMAKHADPPPPWPADLAQLEAIWNWNRLRSRIQEESGDKVFVPKVCWASPTPDAPPVACITWTHGVPTIIPENLVTHVVLVRQKIPSLMKVLGLAKKSAGPEFEVRLIGAETGIHLRGLSRGEAAGQAILVTPQKDTIEIQGLFTGQWPESKLVIVPPDQVCGADLVALMKKA